MINSHLVKASTPFSTSTINTTSTSQRAVRRAAAPRVMKQCSNALVLGSPARRCCPLHKPTLDARARVARAPPRRSATVALLPAAGTHRPASPAVSTRLRRGRPQQMAHVGAAGRTPVPTRTRARDEGRRRLVLVADSRGLPGTEQAEPVVEDSQDIPKVEVEVVAEGDMVGYQSEGWQRRYTMVGLCFVAFLLCNMDRVNMSIAILSMAEQYSWDSASMGIVQSSFFWGYLMTQVLGGLLADRVGGKKVLGFGVVWWSAATVLTPAAASLGLPTLLAARACMGIGEGVAMPAMNSMLSRWVPGVERSRSLALVYSGMYTGSITGLALSPGLIHAYDWPSVFWIFGSLGTVWFAFWQMFAASSPTEDTKISEAERKYIVSNTVKAASVDSIPWKELLSNRAVWAIIISHFCHNWGTFILLTWMPTYYNQVLGFNLQESGLYSVLPWITMAVMANVGGFLADKLVERGVSVTTVRKGMQTIGFLGPAFFLTRLGSVSSPLEAVVCMMCSQGLDSFSQSGLYCNHQDIAPRYSGVLLGISNTAGVLAGVLGTAATGYILENGTWDEVWSVAVALYLIGTVVWNLFSTAERQFD